MDTDTRIRRVCVFCGARGGTQPAYSDAAREMGALLARSGIGLVYGGGSVGLMGAVADGALDAGGEVIGVIPRALAGQELAHPRLTRLHVVESMHARKALMAQLADAFVAMPGGFGTMDELFEIITWAFLGIHDKPMALVSTQGYFLPLVQLFDHLVAQDFASESQRDAVTVCTTPAEALRALLIADVPYTPPAVSAPVEQSVAR